MHTHSSFSALKANGPRPGEQFQTLLPVFHSTLWKTSSTHTGTVRLLLALCPGNPTELPNPGRLLLHAEPARHPTPKEPPNESLMERLRLHRLRLIPSGPRAEAMTSPSGKPTGTPERKDRSESQNYFVEVDKLVPKLI